MSHDYSTVRNKSNSKNSNPEDDEDPVTSMIARTGCLNEHYAVLECMSEKKDWRHCQDFVKVFKNCMNKRNR
ncbi:unnamed protein product [Trichobilharzia regenti]|nr:unnamed protein product [Trichobilharzia regenti]